MSGECAGFFLGLPFDTETALRVDQIPEAAKELFKEVYSSLRYDPSRGVGKAVFARLREMGIFDSTWPPALPGLQIEKTETVQEPVPTPNPNQSGSFQGKP